MFSKVPCGTLIVVVDVDREWLAQARRGVIELCVLALIREVPRYGYQLATALAELGRPLAASEGTLYPLLRRLQREGVVTATWQESRDGPPRKYYHLSPDGERILSEQLAEWDELTQAVSNLRGNTQHDHEDEEIPNEPGHEDEEVPDEPGSDRGPALPRRAPTLTRPLAGS